MNTELTQGAKNSTKASFSFMTSCSKVPAVRSTTSESAAATMLARSETPTGRREVRRMLAICLFEVVERRSDKRL